MTRRFLLALFGIALAALLGIATRADAERTRTRLRFAATSSLLVPARPARIRAAHDHEAHRELPCARCHARAPSSDSARDRLAPASRTCTPCHTHEIAADDPRAISPVDESECATCHLDGEERPLAPVPRIRFSHAAHERIGVACATCHGDADTLASGESHLPTMRSCFACHGGELASAPNRVRASSECTTCHLAMPDGRVRSHWPEGTMNPPPWMFGMQHDRDFLTRHRWVGADQGDRCASCHEESDCSDCHDGRVRPTRIHPNDYLTIHPQMARRNDPRCTSCHTTQTFCGECHARLGVAQTAALAVRARERFHPPPSEWTRGPVRHAHEARRSMTACASCHVENDCVQCHGSLGIGAGLSPHGATFFGRCRELAQANSRACATCHGDAEAIAAQCP